jgi:predicted ester cyclase
MTGRASRAAATSANKRLVHRLVDDVMNGRRFDLLDELATDRLAPKLRTAFEEFLAVFPDWHQEIVEDEDTVVARFRCTGTQSATWQGEAPTGRSMDIDEVSFIRFRDGRIGGLWGFEDTWARIRQLAGRDVTLDELGSLG